MKKIQVNLTHREVIERIVQLIIEYTDEKNGHRPGTDWSWEIGINQDGEPDATCDSLQDHFGAMMIPVVFYDTTASGEISLEPVCGMSTEDKIDWYIEKFMERTPDGFERLEFKSE